MRASCSEVVDERGDVVQLVKQSAPPKHRPALLPGSLEELRPQNAALPRESRELVRANQMNLPILSDAPAFSAWRTTGKRGISVRGCSPSSWRRADLSSFVGRPCSTCSVMTRPVCARRQTYDAISRLLELFDANYGVYGDAKCWPPCDAQRRINLDKDRIGRLMRELGIRDAA